MNSRLISLLMSVVLLVTATVHLQLIPAMAQFQSMNPAAEEVLGVAESVFKFMKAKDYPAIWQGLTMETKNEIVTSVRKAAKKAGQEYTVEQLVQDFASGGPQAKAYWDAYLNVFNPDMVLEDSKWSMGPIDKNVAAIIIQYKKSDKPASLVLKKESGAWRLGLNETFGARKWLP